MVLVRTAVQIAVYVTILVARGESFLPSSTEQKLYTVLQGKGIDLNLKCDILNVKRSDGLSMFHLWPRLRLLHGRPRRAQHHLRLPRGHYPPLSHHAEGQTQHS